MDMPVGQTCEFERLQAVEDKQLTDKSHNTAQARVACGLGFGVPPS